MKEQVKISIIDTLSYFDVFNYPLTLSQIELFLHFEQVSKKELKENIGEISIIENRYGYYFFSGRESIATKRKIQEKDNATKMSLGSKYVSIISKIPGVRLVAITGSLAMGNASKDDDIDLFIITKKNMLWTTRFMVVFLTKILGKKREYMQRSVKDKLCLNMFLDESSMEFENKSLYTAHEIAQMKVLFDHGGVFNGFIKNNLWIQDFFPNIKVKRKKKIKSRWFTRILSREKILRILNFIFFLGQYAYMHKKISREIISLRKAFFHPHDNSGVILNEYKRRRVRYMDMYEISKKFDIFEPKENPFRKVKSYN